MSSTMSDVFITSTDASALNRLLSELTHAVEGDESTLDLSTKLFDANIVGSRALPYNTVRFNSTVTYEEVPTGKRRSVTLVDPRQADASAGRISVLSPIGRALLGHTTGRVVDVELPMGRRLPVRVVDVHPPELDAVEEPAYA
jgi:regulator of nucleoside diphosphate kinase